MLALSLVLGLLSAAAYGASTAVQHAALFDDSGTGDAKGLLGALRNVRWWMSIGGDGVGLVLQVAALSTGPVLLIQPLQVLSLPVAMPIRSRLGGPKPTARDWLAVVAVVVGLGAFLLLVGDPGEPRTRRSGATVVVGIGALVFAAVVVLSVLRAKPVIRAVVLGTVSGVLFAVVAVLIDETAAVFERHSWHALFRVDGALLVLAVLLVGGTGMAVTQASFQVGQLGASFPPSVTVDPVLSVVLGAALLGERLPLDVGHVLGYLAALAVVVTATIELANPRAPGAVAVAT